MLRYLDVLRIQFDADAVPIEAGGDYSGSASAEERCYLCWMRKQARMEKLCEACEKKIFVLPSNAKRKRFCSQTCLGRSNAVTLNGNRPHPTANSGSFTSEQTTGIRNPMWKPPVTLTCRNCESTFQRVRHLALTNTPKYCSSLCRSTYRHEHQGGSRSPFWVGGPKTYRGRGWRELRLIVVRDQRGRCAKCRRHVGDGLPIHHRRPFREFSTADEANARANLIGLCQSCHMNLEPRQRTAANHHEHADEPTLHTPD